MNNLITEFNLFGLTIGEEKPGYKTLMKNRMPINHGFYTKSISQKEFFEMYEENCKEVDLKKPLFIRRGIRRNSDLLYCDTLLHTSQYYSDDYSLLYKIMYKSIKWMGYPVKDRSLDVAYMKGFGNWNSYGIEYMLVPFNNSRFVLKDVGNIPTSISWCSAIMNVWKAIHRGGTSNYFIDHYEECMEELENHNFPAYVGGGVYNNVIQTIRRDMEMYNTSFIDSFENLFDPAKDGYHLEDYEGARDVVNSPKVHGNLLGWTDARVLMINVNYYNKVLKYKF
jgi:hypothetical protein